LASNTAARSELVAAAFGKNFGRLVGLGLPRTSLGQFGRTRETAMNATAEPMPKVVAEREWRQALDAMLTKEKALTRTRDALAAERRRLPMVKIEKSYVFDGADGQMSL